MSDLSLNRSSQSIPQQKLGQSGNVQVPKLETTTEPKPELSESQKKEVFSNQQKLTSGETNIGQQHIEDFDKGVEKTSSTQLLTRSQEVPQPNGLQVERAQTLPIQGAPSGQVSLQDLGLDSEGMKRAKGEFERAMVTGDMAGNAPEKIKTVLKQDLKKLLTKLSQVDNNILLSDKDKKAQLDQVNTRAKEAVARLINGYGQHDELSVMLKLLPESELKAIVSSLVGELREGKSRSFEELSPKKQAFVNKVIEGIKLGQTGSEALKLEPQQPGMKQEPTQLGQTYQTYMNQLSNSLTQLPQSKLAQLKIMSDAQILEFFKPAFGSSESLAPSLIQAVRQAQPPVTPRAREAYVRDLTPQDLLGAGVREALEALIQTPGAPLVRGALNDRLVLHLESLPKDHNTLWKLSLMSAPELKALLQPVGELSDKDAEWLMKQLHGMLPNRSSEQTRKIGNYDVPSQLMLGNKTYEPSIQLGKAGFGIVVKYTNTQDENDHIAVKLLHGEMMNDNANKSEQIRSEAIQELELHRELQGPDGHSGVIGLKGAIPGPNGMLCMVQEFAPGGTLFDLGKELNSLVPPLSTEARQLLGLALVKQSLEALSYMHDERQMLHEDMKSPNIMLGSDGIKLIDFGTSRLGTEQDHSGARQVDNPIYLAPEQLGTGVLRSNTKTEIWAMGTLAYEMMVGRMETHGNYNENFVFRIENNIKGFIQDDTQRFMDKSSEGLPGESRKPVHELINTLMMPKPEDRPSAREALGMDIFKDPRLDSPQMKQILSRLSEPLPQGTPDDQEGSVRFGRVREDLERLSQA